ncbi:hypothetical protein BBJ28_00013826 [Nothophytophthora sp. Chile5]|nr:hypothetical protein BBJ28_00013826 [Nothophytophthora sp. Chile5]
MSSTAVFNAHHRGKLQEMDPETKDCGADSVTKEPRRKRVFQRKLRDQISESRMLEVLDRTLQNERPRSGTTSSSNQEQEQDGGYGQEDGEEELVCVSKMVKVVAPAHSTPESFEHRAGGVLKTVRGIHRLRASQLPQQENQTEHSSADQSSLQD